MFESCFLPEYDPLPADPLPLTDRISISMETMPHPHGDAPVQSSPPPLAILANMLLDVSDTEDQAIPWSALQPQLSRLASRARALLRGRRLRIASLDGTGLVLRVRASAEAWGLQPLLIDEHDGLSDHPVALAPEHLAAFHRREIVVCQRGALLLGEQSLSLIATILLVPLHIGEQLIGLIELVYDHNELIANRDIRALAMLTGQSIALIIDRERLVPRWQADAERASREPISGAGDTLHTMLTTISHEMRNPLTSLQLAIQHMARTLLHATKNDTLPNNWRHLLEEHTKMLLLMNRQSSQLCRLVDDILDISRFQLGRFTVTTAPNNLAGIVGDVIADIRMVWPGRAIQLVMSANQPVMVMADTDRIRQVLYNYVINALKYAPVDRPIRVTVRHNDGLARVLVHNAGPGLSPAQQRAIWDPFYQTTTRLEHAIPSAGLGLGLYISRMIIEHHQGTVGVDSRPNGGVTFWFALPSIA